MVVVARIPSGWSLETKSNGPTHGEWYTISASDTVSTGARGTGSWATYVYVSHTKQATTYRDFGELGMLSSEYSYSSINYGPDTRFVLLNKSRAG